MSRRRQVLRWIGLGLGGALGAMLGAPAIAFVTSPLRRGASANRARPRARLGSLAELPEEQPVRVTVRAPRIDAWTTFAEVPIGAVWLIRRSNEVRAFSTVCPHAGCAIDFVEAAHHFACPCHDSVFALDGARQSGPAPRAMDELPVEIEDGQVFVRYGRFRVGVRGQEPT